MSLASNCFESTVLDAPQTNLAKLQALSLDDKILYSQVKIKEFYLAMRGKVYVAFSGGKDSTVLLHLVRSLYPEVPAVFFDTGLEYPEIREHVKTVENVVWLKPEMTFKQVIEEKGYPVVSKEVAHAVGTAQRGLPGGLKKLADDGRFGVARYAFLKDAPFKISSDCCYVMKKSPGNKYHTQTGRCPFIGMRADEGVLRSTQFQKNGENNLDAKIPKSSPIMIWTSKDIWNYIRRFRLPYASIYDKGVTRTGCVFCMFGATIERDRFVILKKTHPKLWAYCMKEREGGGLGMKEVLDYIGIPTGCGQTTLMDFGGQDDAL